VWSAAGSVSKECSVDGNGSPRRERHGSYVQSYSRTIGGWPVILIVEDDALLRMHAAGLLEEMGFASSKPRERRRRVEAVGNPR
jgi:hypothetical protein